MVSNSSGWVLQHVVSSGAHQMLTISCEAAEGPLVEVSIDVAELEVFAHVLFSC